MATSFLPDSVDAPQKNISSENTNPLENSEEPVFEQDLEAIPETPMPLDALEGHPDDSEHFLEEAAETAEIGAPAPLPVLKPRQPVDPKPIPQLRDDLTLQIEKIMEENLGDVFGALTPVQKQQFKIKGEETANKIRHIIQTTSAKLGKIINLIFDWLKILPGVNHFFLEQEAKIKAEKIIALSHQDKNIL